MRKLALLALALALPGCAQSLAYTRPPADKLVCPEEPGRPVGSGPAYTDPGGTVRNEITDDDNGAYLQDLRGSGQGCRDDVNWLHDWFDSLGKKAR